MEVNASGVAPLLQRISVPTCRRTAAISGSLVLPRASVGYVPSRRIYPEGGYEVDGAYHYYGQPGPFTPEA